MATEWLQRTIDLPAYKRGCHVITKKVYEALPELSQFEVGLANIFILHTSASLTINENASPDVPLDLNDALDRIAPEGNMYRHLDEGPDDMPAHVKSSLMGPSLTVPVSGGRFALGTWQGCVRVFGSGVVYKRKRTSSRHSGESGRVGSQSEGNWGCWSPEMHRWQATCGKLGVLDRQKRTISRQSIGTACAEPALSETSA